jgi:hypothetical protein
LGQRSERKRKNEKESVLPECFLSFRFGLLFRNKMFEFGDNSDTSILYSCL